MIRFSAVVMATMLLLSFPPATLASVPLQKSPPVLPQARVQQGIYTFKLPSGQTVYVKPVHTQPIVTIDTWVKTGSVHETPETNGVSHFLEHLLFKGTPQMPAGEFERVLEAKGGQFNAATSKDYTHYFVTIASPFFQETLKRHANMLLSANIPPEELARERTVVQEEINRAMDNPQRKVIDALYEALYPGHGYAYDTLGPKELIATVPRQTILDYYHLWYRPQNMQTVIVGDVDPEAAARLTQQYFDQNMQTLMATKAFNQVQIQRISRIQQPAIQPLNAPQVITLSDPNVSQVYTAMGFLAPGADNHTDNPALDVAMMVLGDGQSSRLYRELRQQKPLVTDISAGNTTQQLSGLAYVYAETQPENLQAVQQSLMMQLRRLQTEGITPEELEKAKTQVLKDFIYNNESTSGTASGIGYNVAVASLNDYTNYVETVQKVTLADVQRVARQFLDLRQSVWVMLGPVGYDNDKTLQPKLLAMLQAPTTVSGKNPLPRTLAVQQDAEAVTAKTLPNGMRLLLRSRPETDTVAIQILMPGGQLLESKPGQAVLTAKMLTQGSSARTAEALAEALERQGMSLSVSGEEDYLQVSASAVKQDISELLLLLHDVLSQPLFAQAQLDKQKSLLKQALQATQDEPSAIASENLMTTLYKGHPYGLQGRALLPALDAITPADLQAYYERFIRPDNMIVSVVGHINPTELEASLLGLFSVPKAGPKIGLKTDHVLPEKLDSTVDSHRPQTRPPQQSTTITEAKSKQAATWIALGWQGPEADSPDFVPFKVMNTLLGSGMSSRLFVNLREKQGLAYVVQSSYATMLLNSPFTLFIGTDPKNRTAVETGFWHEIERLKTEPVTPEELQRAKDKLAGTFALAHETNQNQAFYLGLYEAMGFRQLGNLGYRFDEAYPKLIQQVTAADIERVANTYLSRPSVLSVVAPASLK